MVTIVEKGTDFLDKKLWTIIGGRVLDDLIFLSLVNYLSLVY